MQLQGKKVIALGERDGIQGSAIAQCTASAGAEGGAGGDALLRLNGRRRP